MVNFFGTSYECEWSFGFINDKWVFHYINGNINGNINDTNNGNINGKSLS